MLVSQNIAIAVFVGIIIIAVFIAWYMETHENYDKGKIHTFIAILAGLGIFMTFIFYLNLIQLQNQQISLAGIQEVSRINEGILNGVLDELHEASQIIPNFVMSVTPLTNGSKTSNFPPDPNNPQTSSERMILSYRIFSMWQDVVITDRYVNIDPSSYVANFLQRANSQQLHQQWLVNKLNFLPPTQTFGDLLFEYGLPITEQIPENYISTAQKLVSDPRFISIF